MNIIKKIKEKHYDFKNRNTIGYKVKRGEMTPQEVLDRQLVNFNLYVFAFLQDSRKLNEKDNLILTCKEKIADYYENLKEQTPEVSALEKMFLCRWINAEKSLMETILLARRQKILYGAMFLTDSDECALVNPGVPEFHISKEDFLKLAKEEKYYRAGYEKYVEIKEENYIEYVQINDDYLSYVYDVFRQEADLLMDKNADPNAMFTPEGYIMLSYGGDFEVIEDDFLDFSELNDENFSF